MPDVRGSRVAAAGLTVVATAVEAALVWRLLTPQPLTALSQTALCLLALVGILLGLVARRPPLGLTPVQRRASLVGLGPSLAGVVGLVAVAVLVGTGHVLPLAAAVAVWCCLGVAVAAAARSRLALVEGRTYGWESLLPGALLLVVLGVLRPVLGGPGFVDLVGLLAGLGGFAAIVVIPSAVAGEGVEGASGVRDHAIRVEALTARRPVLVPLVLAAKIGAVLLVAATARLLRPSWSYLLFSGRIWLLAVVLGLIAVSVLVVEQRLALTAADHRALVRGPTLLLSAGLGAFVGLALLVLVGFVAESVPVAAGCLVGLVVGTVALVHRGPARLRPWVYAAVTVVAGVAAVVVHRRDLPRLPGRQQWMDSLGLDAAVILTGILVAAVVLVVRVDPGRRRRVLLLGAGLAVWVLLVLAAQRIAPGWSILNLDLVLWMILVVAWFTWRLGLQRAIDGFEVVLTAVATSFVLGTTILLESLGTRFASVLLALTLVGPGLVASIRLWRPRRDAGDVDLRRRRVGRACLLYALLLPLVVLAGATSAGTLDQVSSLLVNLLVLPLVLLLISTTSAGRARTVDNLDDVASVDA